MNYLREILAFNLYAQLNGLSATEFRLWHVLMDVANALGWRKAFTIANSRLQSMANMPPRTMYNARNSLVQRGVLKVKNNGNGRAPEYQLVSLAGDDTNATTTHLAQPMAHVMAQPSAQPSAHVMAQPMAPLNKPNETKENKTKPLPPSFPPGGFERFWEAYPLKKAKPVALKAFTKLKPDDALLETMLGAIDSQRMSEQWQRDGGQYIPHPATWLNQRRWEDQGAVPKATVYEEFTGW